MSTEQLSAAVEAASSEARTAYGGFTAFALYFAVTVGATTHEELLLGSQVTMPALGVGLPIVGFYTLVPALFVLFHALLLIQLDILAARGRQLRTAGMAPAGWYGPPFVLSQHVLGGIKGLLRPLVHAAIAVSLILLPLGLLLFVQVRFLPYHSDAVTLWHRLLIVLDLGLVWLLWPRILRASAENPRATDGRRRPAARMLRLVDRRWALFALTLAILLFSNVYATVPPHVATAAAAQDGSDASVPSVIASRLHHVLIEVPTDFLFEAPSTLLNMRRNLRISNAELIGRAPPESAVVELGTEQAWQEHALGIDLRGRDLRYADLSSSDLRKADLRGADLTGAKLQSADLRYADAGDVLLKDAVACAKGLVVWLEMGGEEVPVCRTRLTAASLQNADLRQARLRRAELSRADLSNARLEDSDLDSAVLSDARLQEAAMQGANLQRADLHLADLSKGRLAGANLADAELRGAKLSRADLSFALLYQADLGGADLTLARLDGAFLQKASLDGATLARAYLAGASLRGASIEGVRWQDETANIAFPPFLGWSDLRGAEPAERLKEPDATVQAVTPETLPGFDSERYESNLTALLAGKACRADANPAMLQGLVKRMIEDMYHNGLARRHHKLIAQRLLAELADPDQAVASEPSCRPALRMPAHIRDSVRNLLVALLDVE
jgi:uncharacterized protein YjbI with pentapeptide repeats